MKKIILLIFIVSLAVPIFAEYRVNKGHGKKWKEIKTAHFNVIYPEGNEQIALFAVKYCEDGYNRISSILKYDVSNIIPVIIYPSDIDFQQNNILFGTIPESIGGFTEFSKKRVVVPYNGDLSEFKHVLIHEITHAFQFSILSSLKKSIYYSLKVPLWYTEGMAEYLSIGFDESADMFMRDIVINGTFIDLRNFIKGHAYTGYQIYKQGQSFIYFISQIYGEELIKKIYIDALIGDGFKTALEDNLGLSILEIDRQWQRFYKKKYYRLVENREFDDVSGKNIRDHVKTNSYYNLKPSISNDGKKIAFFTVDNYYFSLKIADIKDGEIINTKKLDGGSYTTDTQYLNVFDNRISWNYNNTKLIYSAQSNDRYVIKIIDIKTKKQKKIKLPFVKIFSPYVDPKMNKIVFSAVRNAQKDIYIYDINQNNLIQVTDDYFNEQNPVFSKDMETIYYTSNKNKKDVYDSHNYSIYSFNIKTKKEMLILKSQSSKDIYLSKDGEVIYYSNSKDGIDNIYSYNLISGIEKKHTNVINGAYSPVVVNGNLYFSTYNYFGYDILTKKETNISDDLNENVSLRYSHPEEEIVYDLSFKQDNSDYNLYKDNLFFILGGTINYGISGVAFGQYSDIFGNKRIMFSAEYLYFNEFQKEINFETRYLYLKKRIDFYGGLFRQKNPFAFYSIDTFNDFFNSAYHNVKYIYRYGVYGGFIYPFTRFTAASIDFTSYRFEKEYVSEKEELNVDVNLNQISLILNGNNLLNGLFGPIDGYSFYFKLRQTIDSKNQDYNFQNSEVSFNKYYNLDNKFIFSFNSSAGKVFGQNQNIKYGLGGYKSLRGYNYNEFYGDNYFMLNSELESVLIESLRFGMGSGLEINKIGFAGFIDIGSAWTGKYKFKTDGRYDDLKIDYGYGFRLHLSNELYLKLDVAWPFDGENQGRRKVQFSIALNQ